MNECNESRNAVHGQPYKERSSRLNGNIRNLFREMSVYYVFAPFFPFYSSSSSSSSSSSPYSSSSFVLDVASQLKRG